MPSDDPELKEVEHRLRTFVRCVIDKASADSDFAEQIKQVFLSETLRQTLSAKGHKKPKREVFDLVAFLGQHDAQLLRKELENKLISELAEIAKQYRVVP